MRHGAVSVVDPLGSWHAGGPGLVAKVRVNDLRAYGALASTGSVGLGSSYVEGWWDSDDLTALVRVLVANLPDPGGPFGRVGRHLDRVRGPFARRRAPDKTADRRNVRAHYDLPGELFEVMLDETMAYSCAVFERPEMSLAEAQRAKFDRLCRKLALAESDHLVEIGSGWGGLALHAASKYGCRVTTTTISAAQREVAERRVRDAGLADRVTVLGRDYRELEGTYDKLVSVEMIEAVDWRLHDTFFATCSELLRPDGLMALQAIVIEDRRFERAKHRDDFVKAMIFPGGCLPSVGSISRSVERATDLAVVDLEDIGLHYAETLRRWRAALDGRWGELPIEGGPSDFARLWELYLAYCEAAFIERHISDVQIVLAKPGWRSALEVRPA